MNTNIPMPDDIPAGIGIVFLLKESPKMEGINRKTTKTILMLTNRKSRVKIYVVLSLFAKVKVERSVWENV